MGVIHETVLVSSLIVENADAFIEPQPRPK